MLTRSAPLRLATLTGYGYDLPGEHVGQQGPAGPALTGLCPAGPRSRTAAAADTAPAAPPGPCRTGSSPGRGHRRRLLLRGPALPPLRPATAPLGGPRQGLLLLLPWLPLCLFLNLLSKPRGRPHLPLVQATALQPARLQHGAGAGRPVRRLASCVRGSGRGWVKPWLGFPRLRLLRQLAVLQSHRLLRLRCLLRLLALFFWQLPAAPHPLWPLAALPCCCRLARSQLRPGPCL